MKSFWLCLLLVVTVVMATCVVVTAQDAPAANPPRNPPAATRGPRPAPTNLQVLAKSMSGDDVVKLMRGYTGDLGVECEFCHAQNPTTHRNDFASDANQVKETARAMIVMTDDLNSKYLEDLPGRRYADPITCGTCHQGKSHPAVFVPKPQQRPAGPPPSATPPVSPAN